MSRAPEATRTLLAPDATAGCWQTCECSRCNWLIVKLLMHIALMHAAGARETIYPLGAVLKSHR